MLLELDYPIWLLCEVAGVSRSSFYKYKSKPINKNTEIDNVIIDIYNKSNKRAGYRTIKFILKNKYKLTVNHKKIQRIMKENNIQSIIRKKFNKPKEPAIIKENLLNRDFKASQPGKKFVTDITYIPTQRKMVYLCTIIDLFNNEPVAWNVSDTQDKNLSIDVIKKLSKKFDLKDSIIHSDQGVHYTSKAYIDLLKELRAKQSMSRRGNCWDNACIENFFRHLKAEMPFFSSPQTLEEVKQFISKYINYYNTKRIQNKYGMSPVEYRLHAA